MRNDLRDHLVNANKGGGVGVVILQDVLHPVLFTRRRVSDVPHVILYTPCISPADLIRVIKSAGPHTRTTYKVFPRFLHQTAISPREWRVHLARRSKGEVHNTLNRGIKRNVSSLYRVSHVVAGREGAGDAKA